MDPITRVATNIAHSLGIYPHDGKKIIFIKNGEFCEGRVIGRFALTGNDKLTDIDRTRIVNLRNEAATTLRTTPARIQRRLFRGEQIMFRDPEKLK